MGRFYREIKGLKPDTTYSLTLEVESNGEKGEVEETFVFKTEDGSSDKPEYAPYAYCSKRNVDSAVIEFNLEEGMWYRMVLHSKEEGDLDRKEFVFQSNGYDDSYTINGLKKDKAYVLTIQHGKQNGEWGVVKREVEIEKYRAEVFMTLSVSGSTFSLSEEVEEMRYISYQKAMDHFFIEL